jgi:ubiquitin C-terminal hydrolase
MYCFHLILAQGKWSLFSSASVTLAQCFDEFTRVETLGGGDWFCEKCKTKRNATKQLQLFSLPPVLFVQLKRFAPDGSRGMKEAVLMHLCCVV